VVLGQTSVNEAMLTGESKPVDKGEGAPVIGGAVNGEGAITVEVRKTGDETYLSQVVAMVRQAQESRSRSQDLANRAAVWLTAIALGGGAVTLVAWLAVGASVKFALARTVTVMVITCPHALGLAVPLVVAVSTALSAGNGLLIRDRSAFERARALDAIVFDKTGTLTEGRFGVTDVIQAQAWPAKGASIADWVTALKFNGDFRGRYDGIYVDAPGTVAAPTSGRDRYRYRIRFGAVATLLDDFEVGLRLTSADPAQNSAFGGNALSGNGHRRANSLDFRAA